MTKNWANLPVLICAATFSINVHSEPAEIIRVFEVDSGNVTVLEAACRKYGDSSKTQTLSKAYEVTYSFRGRIFREIVGYHPGSQIEVFENGKPMSVPYDNKPR